MSKNGIKLLMRQYSNLTVDICLRNPENVAAYLT